MPFTFSHPALVLPICLIRRYYFSVTGLIIGSITPDFEYFFRMKANSIYSHTFSSLFWFNLPVALLLTFIFHNIVRNPLINHLPSPFFQRFSNSQEFNWFLYFKSNWGVVIGSILIGAASHLLWDWFTHTGVTFLSTPRSIASEVTEADFIIKYIVFHCINSLVGGIVLFYSNKEITYAPSTSKNSI